MPISLKTLKMFFFSFYSFSNKQISYISSFIKGGTILCSPVPIWCPERQKNLG